MSLTAVSNWEWGSELISSMICFVCAFAMPTCIDRYQNRVLCGTLTRQKHCNHDRVVIDTPCSLTSSKTDTTSSVHCLHGTCANMSVTIINTYIALNEKNTYKFLNVCFFNDCRLLFGKSPRDKSVRAEERVRWHQDISRGNK